jgi:transcriptional regulator with XRE-family HTH domain
MKNNFTEKESRILKKLGYNVKRLREDLGLLQADLAFQVEVNRSYISDIEGGKRNVSLLVLTKLCKALKVRIEDLTGL